MTNSLDLIVPSVTSSLISDLAADICVRGEGVRRAGGGGEAGLGRDNGKI